MPLKKPTYFQPQPLRALRRIGGMKRFSFLFLALLLTATAAAPSAPEVHIRNDAFNPPVLTVEVGQSVTFTNNDDDAHTVTATDGTFDSKGLDTNGVWRHAFT
ncbi:MAG: cupredoxin domain-containing protein, partial [Candidatus Eremiobacteraeota bacterium]|nr:cupredoxin domain-containing protein [Candidatus Eremiobacteraeota bacterium]